MMKRYNAIFFIFLSILLASCSNKEREVSIFSIPSGATPSELEANGFWVDRDLNFRGETDSHHDGKVNFCNLELGYACVHVSYDDDDQMKRYIIQIDCKPFEKMTGFKAKAYKELEIEGINYQVEKDRGGLSLKLTRIGLNN